MMIIIEFHKKLDTWKMHMYETWAELVSLSILPKAATRAFCFLLYKQIPVGKLIYLFLQLYTGWSQDRALRK